MGDVEWVIRVPRFVRLGSPQREAKVRRHQEQQRSSEPNNRRDADVAAGGRTTIVATRSTPGRSTQSTFRGRVRSIRRRLVESDIANGHRRFTAVRLHVRMLAEDLEVCLVEVGPFVHEMSLPQIGGPALASSTGSS